jgi:hypothetical protein
MRLTRLAALAVLALALLAAPLAAEAQPAGKVWRIDHPLRAWDEFSDTTRSRSARASAKARCAPRLDRCVYTRA